MTTTWLFAMLGIWLLIGLVAALVMGRRGYDPWSWAVIGAIFGPLVPIVAIARRRRHAADEQVLRIGARADRGVAVLVGVDGSTEALAATREVVDLLDDRLGSITLATVVDFDAADALHEGIGRVYEHEAQALLDAAASCVAAIRPTMVILAGRPADALVTYARRHDIDLLVVGARGRGLSDRLLGSVVEQLVRTPDVLVLVGGRAGERAPRSANSRKVTRDFEVM